MTTTRAQRAEALARWVDDVDDLVEANTAALRAIAEPMEQRDDIERLCSVRIGRRLRTKLLDPD